MKISIVGVQRSYYATVGTGGSFGASSLQQEIGLGDAVRIKVLEIDWPTSGIRQTFHDLEVDRFFEITEGADRPEALERQRIVLGGGDR